MTPPHREPEEPSHGLVPDVDVSTTIRARELRFKTVPETKVWFEGEPAEQSRSDTERENLPDEVEPNVTYRDVMVRWNAGSRIAHPSDSETP